MNGKAVAFSVALVVFGIWLYQAANAPRPGKQISAVQSAPRQTDAPEPTERPKPTERPTAKPDRHAEREVVHAWWHKVVFPLAISSETVQMALNDLQNGDASQASSILQEGEKYTSMAFDAVGNDRPAGWDDVSDKLLGAASKYKDALVAERQFLDTEKPSDGAEASTNAGQGAEYLAEATHAARLQYEGMGGKWSDLDDLPTMQQSVHSVVKALSGQ